MALSVRCEHCGWLLSLDDAFAGARCRCSHCGDVTSVSADSSAATSRPRPPRPAVQRPLVRPAHAEPGAAAVATISIPPLPSRVLPWTIAGVLVVAGLSQWILRADSTVSPRDLADAAASPLWDSNLIARVPSNEVLAGRRPAFLQRPITEPVSAWLIDGSAAMGEYYADVTTLVATSIAQLKPPEQKFVLYVASGARPEYLQVTPAGSTGVALVQGLLRGFRPAGTAKLARAFDELASSRPNVVFLLVAQPTDLTAVSAMIVRAKQDGISVCVTTIGMPNHGWASLALETHGEYVSLRDRDLHNWVDRVTSPPLPQFEERNSQVDSPRSPLAAGGE